MTPHERSRLYRAALAKYGKVAQIDMLHEEIGELLSAIGHYRRGRDTASDVLSEIADVRIMLEQLTEIIGYTEMEVDAEMDRKLKRLAGRVGEGS